MSEFDPSNRGELRWPDPGVIAGLAINAVGELELNSSEFDAAAYLAYLRQKAQLRPPIPDPPKREFKDVIDSTKDFLDRNSDSFEQICHKERYLRGHSLLQFAAEDHPSNTEAFMTAKRDLSNDFVLLINRFIYISWEDSYSRSEARLSEEQIESLRKEVYPEWIILNELRHEIEPVPAPRAVPLLKLNVSLLQDALSQNLSDRQRQQLISIFIRTPHRFLQVTDSNFRAEIRQQRVVSPRESFLNDLAADSLANPRYSKLTSPSVPDGFIFNCIDLEDMDSAIFAVVAALEKTSREKYGEPRSNVWSPNIIKPIEDRLRPKGFNGRLTNLRLVVLPTEEQFIEKHLKSFKDPEPIDRTNIKRLCAIADMDSTKRRSFAESLVDIVVYARRINDPKYRLIVCTQRRAGTGQRAFNHFKSESSTNALSILSSALRRPILSGLSEQGKNR